MLDCGAGTYEQFVYHYPPHQLEDKLLKLKVLFLTHLHADHNLGTLDLISKRN
jgi:ribonuclease Z